MTDWYIENRIADYTNRIATNESLKNFNIKKGNLLAAKNYEKKIQELTKELINFKKSVKNKIEIIEEEPTMEEFMQGQDLENPEDGSL